MRFISAATAVLLFMFVSVPAVARTFMVLPLQEFSRQAGRPVAKTVSFTAADTVSTYTLNLYNGRNRSGRQARPVSALVVRLNGEIIIRPGQVKPRRSLLSIPITLRAKNRLSVELRGRPGGVIALEILGQTFEQEEEPLPEVEANPAETGTATAWNELGLVDLIDGPRTDVEDVTRFDYDGQGNLIKVINPLGQETTLTAHDADGRPLTIVDPNGTVTELAYDARGRLLSRSVDGATTTFAYDAAGNIIQMTLPNGAFLINEYDFAQRLIAVEDKLGNRIDYTLDAAGNRIQQDVSDPQGTLTRSLSRQYNSLNRLMQQIGGAGQVMTFGYDANGNQTTLTVDPGGLNQEALQAFDGLNRLTTVTDALQGVTEFAYDAQDNLIAVTDARGLTTEFVYDGLSRLIAGNSPDTGLTTFSYDAAGNRIAQLDARGIETHFVYDALNRPTRVVYPDPAQNVTMAYDDCLHGIGRLCLMADESGTTAFAYDPRGNLVMETTLRDGIEVTIRYAYDDADQLIQITHPSGRTVKYAHNALGQVASVSTTLNGQTTVLADFAGYRPFGPLESLTHGNNLLHVRSYDLDYRLSQLMTVNGAMLQDLNYTYDSTNNITGIQDFVDANRSQAFGYDALNRLTDAGGSYGNRGYSYDANGNRLTEIRDSHVSSYRYDSFSHRLQAISNGGTQSFQHDANGNTVDNTDFAFLYGDNNRLKEARVNQFPVGAYVYNGRGERVKKDAGEARYFYYDQSGQLLAELDAFGDTIVEYVYLDGMPLALITNDRIHAIHTDHLGTPQILTDENQQVVWQADYEPFGKVDITTELVTNNLRFPGQYFDEETGLHYNINRYFDPKFGRYITSDPIGLIAGTNTYGYVFQNPIVLIDPLGLMVNGEWIQTPRVDSNSINARYIDWEPTIGIDRYLSLLLLRLSFEVSGTIIAEVKCTDDCGNISIDSYSRDVLTSENIDLGPNIIATGAGLLSGRLVVSAVVNAIIVDLKLNQGLQRLGTNLEAKAVLINDFGADAVCRLGWPPL